MVIVYMLGTTLTGLFIALVVVVSFFGETVTTSEGIIFMVDNVGGYYLEFGK